MAGPRFHLVLLTTLAALVLCAALAPARAGATEESAEPADDGTITTVLQPGWNMVGWLGADMDASEIFDQVPNLERVSAWDAENQRYQRRTRTSVGLHGLRELTPGRGLWLYVGGAATVEWTRPSSEDSVLHELHAGRNLVAWAGRDGTPIEDAVVRFGDTFVRASLWDASTKRYLHYRPGRESTNPLRELNHGDALWVDLTEDARWWQSGAAPPPVTFLGEFTEERRTEIREWVDGTRRLFAERWGVEAPFTTYVGDREAVAPTYQRVRGSNSVTPCGNYSNSVIFLVDGCVNGGAHAHEYFHALQYHLIGRPYKRLPGWMLEGSASYALILYRGTVSTAQTGDERIQEARHQDAVFLRRHKVLTLPELDDYSATVKPGNFGFTLGFLAVAWLAERAGEQAIIDFFVRLGDEPGWREAFKGAFGLNVDDFYEQFAAYRAEVAAPLPHVKDDSNEPALVFVGDVPADTREAVREEFERVQAFVAEELGGGTADYTMLVAADKASAETAHRLVLPTEYDGRCSNLLFGVAGMVSLGCGAIRGPAYALLWPHFESVRNQLTPSASLPLSPDGRGTRGPAWFHRGVFTYVNYRYLDGAGHEDYGSRRAREVSRAKSIMLPLSDMVAYEESGTSSSSLRAAVGFLAAEWLLEHAGDTALFEYYRLLPGSETWEEPFESAFGIAVDDFYEAFETHRAEVAPPFPHLVDDREEPVLVFVGDVAAEAEAAIRAEFDALRAWFGEQLGAETADYTLFIGADRDALVDTHRRVMGTEVSERFCIWAPYGGAGIINLDCRSAVPYGLDTAHFIGVREQVSPWRSLPAAPDGFDRRGPVWLRYGAELYVAHAYRDARGYEDVQTNWHRRSSLARQTARLLNSVSTWEGINEEFSQGVALGFLAVEWLADRAGDPVIFEYYRLLPEAETWEEAFEAAFGIAVDDFYEAFEATARSIAPR